MVIKMQNIGWMFYKESFFDIDKLKEINEKILNSKLSDCKYKFYETEQGFKLTTTYPGLLIGIGYPHSLKDTKENFDFGFFFDYTTGLPIIPGSTVKGVLRSLFGQNKKEKYKKQKEQLIKDFLGKPDSFNVEALFKDIFLGIDENGKNKPTYKRDIFFDAFIVKSKDDLIFNDDYITKHPSPTTEPEPNKMLKIAPEVTFRFNFELHDGVITAKEKEDLFLELLKFNGIGAKTNVGYGQLE